MAKRLKITYGDEVWCDVVPFKVARFEVATGVIEVHVELRPPPPKPSPGEQIAKQIAAAAKQRKQKELNGHAAVPEV